MAIVTLRGRISRALDFYNKSDKYFQFGGMAPWFDPTNSDVSDANPPYPGYTDVITDIMGYKRVSQQYFVVQDPTGTVNYRGEMWKIVDGATNLPNLIALGTRWVYVSCYIEYNELPVNVSYRKIGVCTALTVKSGVASGKQVLLPSEVEDEGLLEVLDYRTPIYRSIDQREFQAVILEF